jgi:hypothetical protein
MGTKSRAKYQRLKPGLYFTGANAPGNFNFGLIYVLGGEYQEAPEVKPLRKKWSGVIYNYFDFKDKGVYTFNEYWEAFIDELRPVKDEVVIERAEREIKKYRAQLEARNQEIINLITIGAKDRNGYHS